MAAGFLLAVGVVVLLWAMALERDAAKRGAVRAYLWARLLRWLVPAVASAVLLAGPQWWLGLLAVPWLAWDGRAQWMLWRAWVGERR